jgi:putative addiction module component (TIGR02574 family)
VAGVGKLGWAVTGLALVVEMHWRHVMPFPGPCLTPGSVSTMDSLPGGVMAFAPMSDLLQLPQGERLALAIALWDSLDDQARDGALSVDPALCAELDRRWASHLENPDAALAWDEVRSQLGLG